MLYKIERKPLWKVFLNIFEMQLPRTRLREAAESNKMQQYAVDQPKWRTEKLASRSKVGKQLNYRNHAQLLDLLITQVRR